MKMKVLLHPKKRSLRKKKLLQQAAKYSLNQPLQSLVMLQLTLAISHLLIQERHLHHLRRLSLVRMLRKILQNQRKKSLRRKRKSLCSLLPLQWSLVMHLLIQAIKHQLTLVRLLHLLHRSNLDKMQKKKIHHQRRRSSQLNQNQCSSQHLQLLLLCSDSLKSQLLVLLLCLANHRNQLLTNQSQPLAYHKPLSNQPVLQPLVVLAQPLLAQQILEIKDQDYSSEVLPQLTNKRLLHPQVLEAGLQTLMIKKGLRINHHLCFVVHPILLWIQETSNKP